MNATTFQPVEATAPQPTAPRRPALDPAPAAVEPDHPLDILKATYVQDYRTIASYLLRRTGDHDLAQELASETFAEAIRSLDRWNPMGLPLRAWLFRIATRRLSHHRRRHGRSSRFIARLLGAGHPRAPNPTLAPSDASRVREAISRLRPSHQDVLVLHHVEGLSIAEISLTLAIAEGTVKSRLSRARADMQAHLSRLGVNP